MAKKGLLMVHTGNGKGKTTAGLGLAFRALGHDLPVCMIQFIKGSWKYGELRSTERFKPLFDLHVAGEGFTWESKDLQKDIRAARHGWELAKAAIASNHYYLIILDEFTYAINYSMVNEEEALETLRKRPEDLHVLVTGRDAPESIVQIADLVTEMSEIKHPNNVSIKAQKGIEWWIPDEET